MSRHYYDMTHLIGHDAKARAMADISLLDEVGHHKSAFFKPAWARYEDAKPGSLHPLPNDKLEAALRRDYAGMRGMIIGYAPIFDDVMSAIAGREAENQHALTATVLSIGSPLGFDNRPANPLPRVHREL